LSSGGSPALEGSPLVRLGWRSQLFDLPIRISGAASLETERFTNAPGAAIDYISIPKMTRTIHRSFHMCRGWISIPRLQTTSPPDKI
jgi:hypothetical protein